MVHHADYLSARDDQALCGVAIQNATALSKTDSADALCPDCEARLVVYHLEWWRSRSRAAIAELEALRGSTPTSCSPPLPSLRAPATEIEQDQAVEPVPAEATTFLDHARRELSELCGQFDNAVPFYRLNKTMQDFSDTLNDDERVLAGSGDRVRQLPHPLGDNGSRIPRIERHEQPCTGKLRHDVAGLASGVAAGAGED